MVKRASDRKSVYLRVRLTKGERAAIRRQGRPGESFSETVRRLVLPEPVVTFGMSEPVASALVSVTTQ